MVIAPKLEKLKHTEMEHHHSCLMFPQNFMWGAATSSHQVEGGNTKNDWWAWEQIPGKINDGTKSGKAVDHYNLYEKDFDLAKKLGHNVHRLSIEWSRIEPVQGQWDDQEIEHYKNVLQALKDREIKTMLTLYHFTLPKWFYDRGGWLHPSAIKDFQRFADKLASELGDLIDYWITINEPHVYATQCYLYGLWPPEKKSNLKMLRVIYQLAKAHRRAYKAIRQQRPQAKIGFANNCLSIETYNKHTLIDFLYVKWFSWFWNRSFYFLSGRRNHDYIGINYYFHQRIRRQGLKFIRLIDSRIEFRDHNDLGWEINPDGLFDVLLEMNIFKLPIIITENGTAAENDNRRARALVRHIRSIYQATAQKVNVIGYIHWSLLDNFEWKEGFKPRFGLIHVDYQTMKRTPKDSAKVFQEIAQENTLCHKFYGYLGHNITYNELKEY